MRHPARTKGTTPNTIRPDRRLPTYSKNSGRKGTGPGALSLPGTGHRFEQLFFGNKKDAEESARGKHHEVRESGDPGRDLFRVPEPPEFPCELCAEVPGHFFPDLLWGEVRIYIGGMVEVRSMMEGDQV